MIRFLVLLCFLAGMSWTPRAAAETAEDPVALAAMLVQDGHWDRARSVLDSVDPDAPGIDRVRLFATRGLLALYDQDSSSAISFFGAALTAIEEDPESEPGPAIVQLYLARAHMMANAPTEVLAALDATGNVAQEREVGWRLRVQAHQALGDLRNAWLAAEAGQERFPIGTVGR